jgi:hypothetical protein
MTSLYGDIRTDKFHARHQITFFDDCYTSFKNHSHNKISEEYTKALSFAWLGGGGFDLYNKININTCTLISSLWSGIVEEKEPEDSTQASPIIAYWYRLIRVLISIGIFSKETVADSKPPIKVLIMDLFDKSQKVRTSKLRSSSERYIYNYIDRLSNVDTHNRNEFLYAF